MSAFTPLLSISELKRWFCNKRSPTERSRVWKIKWNQMSLHLSDHKNSTLEYILRLLWCHFVITEWITHSVLLSGTCLRQWIWENKWSKCHYNNNLMCRVKVLQTAAMRTLRSLWVRMSAPRLFCGNARNFGMEQKVTAASAFIVPFMQLQHFCV